MHLWACVEEFFDAFAVVNSQNDGLHVFKEQQNSFSNDRSVPALQMLQQSWPSDSQVSELCLRLLTERLNKSIELRLVRQTQFFVALKYLRLVFLFRGLSCVLLLGIFELFEVSILHVLRDFHHR